MNENKQTDSLRSAQRKENHILLPSSRGKPAHESIQGEEAGIVWLPAKLTCMSNAALLLVHYDVVIFFPSTLLCLLGSPVFIVLG